MYALLSTHDGPRYGTIRSRHRTEQAAEQALATASRAVSRHTPNALTHLMYCVESLPTPAGGNGKVGDYIAIDLSRV